MSQLNGVDRLEQQEQTKILAHLIKAGFHAIKIVTATKAGEPDIVAVEPQKGRFWGIEVKRDPSVQLPPLQAEKLHLILENNGIAFCAYGYEDFKIKYKLLQSGGTCSEAFFRPFGTK
jgi:hypothetical protein